MIIAELKRYVKSGYSIISLLISVIPVLISYYFTNQEKLDLYESIASNSSDLDLASAKASLAGINGFTYLFDFLFSSDFYIIFVIILSLSFGIILGSVELKNRKSGFGNMIFSRINLKKGTSNIILAQILYVTIYIIGFFAVLTAVTLIIFPVDNTVEFSVNILLNITSSMQCILLMTEHIFKLLIYSILVVIFTYGISCFINNKYIIPFVPVMIYFVPLLICSLVGNAVVSVGEFTTHFIAEMYLMSTYDKYAMDGYEYFNEFFIPVLLIAASAALMLIYFKKLKRNYL